VENNTSVESRNTSAIDLDISGSGLLLKGRFVDWESGVTMGPDLDKLQVRLAIDATSARIDAAGAHESPLFSFHGRDATPVGEGLYQVDGQLEGPSGTRDLRAQIETPIEHSAVVLLSFQARKSDFGDEWTRLLSNVVPFRARGSDGGKGPTMPAYGWLTVPHLAAA
jgi:polyisoprenoid-binding protein YceI